MMRSRSCYPSLGLVQHPPGQHREPSRIILVGRLDLRTQYQFIFIPDSPWEVAPFRNGHSRVPSLTSRGTSDLPSEHSNSVTIKRIAAFCEAVVLNSDAQSDPSAEPRNIFLHLINLTEHLEDAWLVLLFIKTSGLRSNSEFGTPRF